MVKQVVLGAVVLLAGLGCTADPGGTPVPAVAYAEVPGTTTTDIWACSGDSHERAQSFTAPKSGQINRISLVVATQDHPPDPLVVRIVPLTRYGWPDRTILGQGTYSGLGGASLAEFIDIPMSAPATVTAGQGYAIELSTGSPTCPPAGKWLVGLKEAAFGSGQDPFPGGKLWTRTRPYGDWAGGTTADLLFKVWMS